jgi:hypothetical protein
VGEGSTNQFSAAELADVQHVRSAPMVSSLGGGLPIDTLVTTVAVPVRPILAEIPLQLLDRRDTNVVEQLLSKRLDRSFQDTVQGRKSWWQPPLVHFEHTKLAFNLPRELRSSVVRGQGFQTPSCSVSRQPRTLREQLPTPSRLGCFTERGFLSSWHLARSSVE